MTMIGAVVKLIGNCFRLKKGSGIVTGCITKIIERTKSTKVAMEGPETIWCKEMVSHAKKGLSIAVEHCLDQATLTHVHVV